LEKTVKKANKMHSDTSGRPRIKKVYDWLAATIEKKMKERDEGQVEVTIYGASGQAVSIVTRTPDKPKRKK